MLHEFVTAHPLLVQIVCFMLPMLVMMFGPSDAAVRRLWHGLPLRVWQWETMAVMAAVYIVIAVAGNSPGEWIGFAALVFAHGRNSVMFRLAEQQRASMPADPHHVECWRWNLVYFCLGEGFWALYFTYHESWVGLAGVGIFAAYAQWRRWYSGRQAKKVASAGANLEVVMSGGGGGGGAGNMGTAQIAKRCEVCRRILIPLSENLDVNPASPVKRADGSLVCLGCDIA